MRVHMVLHVVVCPEQSGGIVISDGRAPAEPAERPALRRLETAAAPPERLAAELATGRQTHPRPAQQVRAVRTGHVVAPAR